MTKSLPIIAAAILALTLTGCSTAGATKITEAPEPIASETAGTPIPDVVGMPGNDARDALLAAGFLVEFDADGKVVLMAGNWNVEAQSPAAGETGAAGDTVTLTVSKPEKEPTAQEATSTGLTGTYAQAACDMRGAAEFPFGWDPHWILGKLADEIQDDRWFLKATADVKNEYNAEQEINFECYVSGTNEAPVVEEFLAY